LKFHIFLYLTLASLWTIAADKIDKSIIAMPNTKEKVDVLNNKVDQLLKPVPTIENCKKAEDIALEAAKIAEKLDYKIGMARSYEQLTTIYKTLDYQLKYMRYKSKAVLIDRGGELKKQEDKIKQQKEEAEKIKMELDVLAQDNSISKEIIEQKEKALNEASEQLIIMTEETERLATKNKLLVQDQQIKKMEVYRQKMQKYFLISMLGVLAILALVMFKLFKTKQKTAYELREKNEIITLEKKRSDDLLLNILPLETANELKINGKATARHYEMATVLFTDFKDFTILSETLSPIDLVDVIDMCFCAFDTIIEKHGIEKIKTIGDAYLCVDGIAHDIPEEYKHNPSNAIDAAFEILDFMEQTYKKREAEGLPFFKIRIGLNSGPLVAGVVGRKKFAYDIWGDTVNTAARMEQNSEPGKINITSKTHSMVEDNYIFTHRGKIEAKNKGNIEMYFVDSKKN